MYSCTPSSTGVRILQDRPKIKTKQQQLWGTSFRGGKSDLGDPQTLTGGQPQANPLPSALFPLLTQTHALPEQSVLWAEQALWSNRRKPKAVPTLSVGSYTQYTPTTRRLCKLYEED